MRIQVDDPQKQTAAGAQGSFITYRVTVETNLETFASKRPKSVRRRYQDFVWLQETLAFEYPASVVPPLPEKHRLSYIKGDRFSEEFLERRKWGLQWFMDRIAIHSQLQRAQCTRIFLESADFVKKPDQRFIDMQDYVDKLEDNIKNIEHLYKRISKRQNSLQQDYANFAWSIREIAAIESEIMMPLRQFAETTETYSKHVHDMTNKEDVLFMNDLHELLAYCQALKNVLRKRDESQIDFEELSVYLQRTIEEREKHPDKTAEYDKKIEEVLEAEVARTSDITNGFSEQMTEEFAIFQQQKANELKQGMLAYADSHVDFYQKGATLWESILPVLEGIQLEESPSHGSNVQEIDS
ncbi:Phox homologous domain-containing protein [Dichotomocladium elegans]|nr:Phox homologous domain-containing protein [Dichotomocladium elegans]